MLKSPNKLNNHSEDTALYVNCLTYTTASTILSIAILGPGSLVLQDAVKILYKAIRQSSVMVDNTKTLAMKALSIPQSLTAPHARLHISSADVRCPIFPIHLERSMNIQVLKL